MENTLDKSFKAKIEHVPMPTLSTNAMATKVQPAC